MRATCSNFPACLNPLQSSLDSMADVCYGVVQVSFNRLYQRSSWIYTPHKNVSWQKIISNIWWKFCPKIDVDNEVANSVKSAPQWFKIPHAVQQSAFHHAWAHSLDSVPFRFPHSQLIPPSRTELISKTSHGKSTNPPPLPQDTQKLIPPNTEPINRSTYSQQTVPAHLHHHVHPVHNASKRKNRIEAHSTILELKKETDTDKQHYAK